MEVILKYFPNLSDKQKVQFSKLQGLYKEWNIQINVISRKDIENLYLKTCITLPSYCKSDRFFRWN